MTGQKKLDLKNNKIISGINNGHKVIKKYGLDKNLIKKNLSILQIAILIISIIAFSYFLAQDLPSVDAQKSTKGVTVQTPSSMTKPDANNFWAGGLSGLGTGWLLSKLDIQIPELPPWWKVTETTASPPAEPGWIERTFFTSGTGLTSRLTTFGYAAGAVVVISFLVTWIATGDIEKAARVAARTAVGATAGYALLEGLVAVGAISGPAGWVVSAFVAVGVWIASLFTGATDRTVTFQCKLWQPPTGGDDCNICNNGLFPCTEYQCRSLGTGCELINKDSDEPRCVWKNKNDTAAPEIKAWTEALQPGYRYEPLSGARGVEIKYQSQKCLPEWTPFTFGIELNKEGYCKIMNQSTKNFSEMKFDFGGSTLYKKQHIQQMTFPGAQFIQKYAPISITNAGQFEFYVRCESAVNGKANIDEFLFKFCTSDEPDNTQPIITGFNPRDGTPVAYFSENQVREIRLQVFTNEPAECKWSLEDKSYETMENSLSCPASANPLLFNANLNYVCNGNLTGLQNNMENKFYFRCNDTSGNVNGQSKALTLLGTEALYISSATPNETVIKSSTTPVKVTLRAETNAGFRRGEATCSYSKTGVPGSYVRFSNTSTNMHATNVYLDEGNYTYYIRCFDDAGNSDTTQVNFEVQTDTSAPIVVRAYKDANNLKIITNEEGSCVYSTGTLDCEYNFDQGLNMTRSSSKKIHSTAWDKTKTYYVKCQDEFGNRPLPNQCSIKVRPFEIGP